MCATEKALLELTAGLPPGLTIPVQQMDSGGLHALIAKSLNECVSKILEGKQQVDPISLILWKQLLLSQDQLAASSKTIQNLQAEIVTLNDKVADLENKTVQSEMNQRDLKTEVQLLQKEANIATQLAQQPSTNTFPLVSLKGAEAPVEPRFTQRSQPYGTSVLPQAPSDRDLDKIALNIPRFEPEPDGSNDVHQYLRDIDFFLRRFPKATVDDKIYLIKVSSSREVGRFIERQPPQVKRDYPALCKALENEFSNHLVQTGLAAALAIKQSRQETPLQYYHRLRHAYFGYRNEPGMEEEEVFKTLFVRNLHPSTSHSFGVAACPHTLTSRQLRDLALRGFAKFQQNIKKKSESNDVLIINEQSSHVKQKGAHKAPMPPKTQLNHKNQRVFHSWRRSSLHWAQQSDQKPSYRRKGRIKHPTQKSAVRRPPASHLRAKGFPCGFSWGSVLTQEVKPPCRQAHVILFRGEAADDQPRRTSPRPTSTTQSKAELGLIFRQMVSVGHGLVGSLIERL
uniref:Retrotransposon gag domain-containing protein n=1 Tax=Astyanax mexicanus TaxID=7994 RepID=A0A3B1KJ75_ASTMX